VAIRIFSLFLLAFAVQATTEGQYWIFYPLNTYDKDTNTLHSGLEFHFTAPEAETASIAGVVVDCGAAHPISGEISTDTNQGGAVLRFSIHSLDGFAVQSLTVTIGSRTVTIKDARAGKRYAYR